MCNNLLSHSTAPARRGPAAHPAARRNMALPAETPTADLKLNFIQPVTPVEPPATIGPNIKSAPVAGDNALQAAGGDNQEAGDQKTAAAAMAGITRLDVGALLGRNNARSKATSKAPRAAAAGDVDDGRALRRGPDGRIVRSPSPNARKSHAAAQLDRPVLAKPAAGTRAKSSAKLLKSLEDESRAEAAAAAAATTSAAAAKGPSYASHYQHQHHQAAAPPAAVGNAFLAQASRRRGSTPPSPGLMARLAGEPGVSIRPTGSRYASHVPSE